MDGEPLVAQRDRSRNKAASTRLTGPSPAAKQQIVLVLQGGCALGAYQAGVYQGLHEAGIEPDWIIGTSIGAINGALIAGNTTDARVPKLLEFWGHVAHRQLIDDAWPWADFMASMSKLSIITQGISGFFRPNPWAALGPQMPLGVEYAAFYSTEPLKNTLHALTNFDCLNAQNTRLTVGAVNVRTGDMAYFDTRQSRLGPEHILASSALPPAFPAIRINGEAYWDGGLCSNTPIEAALDDNPRRDSIIFVVNVWQKSGAEPDSLWDVLSRRKDIQYASHETSHIARQERLHQLRHVIQELSQRLPADQQNDPKVLQLAAYGCKTTMHLVELLVPSTDHDDHTKDVDFANSSIRSRWQMGRTDVSRVVAARPWERPTDSLQGIVVHRASGM
jgi:NTE family protein